MLGLLPALQNPTVSDLSDRDWVAVNTILDETVVRHIIPRLKTAALEESSSTRSTKLLTNGQELARPLLVHRLGERVVLEESSRAG